MGTAICMAATANGMADTPGMVMAIGTMATGIEVVIGAAAMADGGAAIGTAMASAPAGGWYRAAGSGSATRL